MLCFVCLLVCVVSSWCLGERCVCMCVADLKMCNKKERKHKYNMKFISHFVHFRIILCKLFLCILFDSILINSILYVGTICWRASGFPFILRIQCKQNHKKRKTTEKHFHGQTFHGIAMPILSRSNSPLPISLVGPSHFSTMFSQLPNYCKYLLNRSCVCITHTKKANANWKSIYEIQAINFRFESNFRFNSMKRGRSFTMTESKKKFPFLIA